MKKRGSTLVPRNPYAPAAHQRKAGAHDTLKKIRHRDERRRLRHEFNELKKGQDSIPALFIFSSFSFLTAQTQA